MMNQYSHTHCVRCHKAYRGAALFVVLALLALFSSLGTIYLQNMMIELDAADLIVQGARAEAMAEAGINVAISELQRALDEGGIEALLTGEAMEYEFPAYRAQRGEGGIMLASEGGDFTQTRKLFASIRIEDECAKLNLNHTPASVLSCLLGNNREVARQITRSLPTSAGGDAKAWLLHPDDLRARNLLSKEQYASIDPGLMTTDSVLDHAKPVGFLNLNTVPPNVLAAILAVSPEEAKNIVAMRPFESFADLVTKSGKDPSTFNIKPDPLNPSSMPQAFTLRSRLYRIKSTGVYAKLGATEKSQYNRSAYAEAVVQLNTDGSYEILRWTAQRGTK